MVYFDANSAYLLNANELKPRPRVVFKRKGQGGLLLNVSGLSVYGLIYRKCLARFAANIVGMLTPRRPGITSKASPALSVPWFATER